MLNFKAIGVKYEKAIGGIETIPLPDFSFTSDELLLDLKGGGDRDWPGELLLLDASGRLTVRTEVLPKRRTSSPSPTAVRFADESKRLERIYNYVRPMNAAGGIGPGSNDFLPPPKRMEKKKP